MDDKQLTKLIRLAEEGDMYLQEQIDEVETKIKELVHKPEFSVDAQVEKVAMKLAAKMALIEKGDNGEQGEQGDAGLDGLDGKDGIDGKDGKDGKDGVGRDGHDGRDGRDGLDGRNGLDGNDGSPDSPDQVITKINQSKLLIAQERIAGLTDIITNMLANAVSSVGITTTNFFSGGRLIGRAKNVNFVTGATVTVVQDQANISITAGTGTVNSVVAGTGISVNSTDPANPIVSATGGTFSIMVPTGTVDGVNKVFVFSSAPSVVVTDDAATMNKTKKDATTNWSGTTTVTMVVAPTFNIFGY